MEIFYIVVALLLGCLNVVNRTISFQATQHLGTDSGCLMNYIVGSIASLCVLLAYPNAQSSFANIAQAPFWLYFGGVFGGGVFFLNITSLNKMNLFQSAVIILIGQLIASFILDIIFGYSFSSMKIIGIAVMTIGVIWDRKVSFN